MREIKMRRDMRLMGNDILIWVDNEEGSHIGSCVMATPYQKDHERHVTCQIINQITHKEEEVARLYAKEVSLITGHSTCCVCGIHIDNIEPDEMAYIRTWCLKDIKTLKQDISHMFQA